MNRSIFQSTFPRAPRAAMQPVAAAVLMVTALASAPVLAQLSTATVRGSVTLAGETRAGVAIVATNTANGFNVRTVSQADGSYTLLALQPGSYRIAATAEGMTPAAQLITVQVGQNVSLNLTLDAAPPVAEGGAETVVVTGLRDNRTSEVGTNISQKQIQALPQTTRNFLSFADLAPGVQFTTGADGSTQLRGGAQTSSGINVFIDGVGQKNYVIQGGITGQDSSRGNPFPQSAIAEYKVTTQNYKAEFDQISSAAVTAVTKSGTNEFHGEVFYDHTNGPLRAKTPAEEKSGKKVPSKEDQYGISMGGPIILDRMHWFLAYEGKTINSPKTIVPGGGLTPADLPPPLQAQLGPANAPFREDLVFGKVDFSIDDDNLVELSLKVRQETEVTNVGDQSTASYGTDKKNDETRADLRWQRSAATWVNDARVTYEDAKFSPRARTDALGTVYTAPGGAELLRTGGGRDFQNKAQDGYALQNDFTYTGFEWKGSHVFKVGAKVKQVNVNAQEQNPLNPQFFYDVTDSGDPFKVQFGAPLAGIGDGRATSRNTQVGLYAQDDWEVNKNLTLNLGLRWDYEQSPGYLDYVTPADVVAAMRSSVGINAPGSGVDVNDYISTGNNRKSFKDAWQPRVGFSFDLNADQQHVIFGGYARAYDRNLFDYLQLERTKATFPGYEFLFNTPNHPCDEGNCLGAFSPSYLDPAVLAALANGTGAGREINVINNNLKTPYSDQFSLGMRNRVGLWNTEVTYSHIDSKDGFAFLLGNRRDAGNFFLPGTVWGAPFGSPLPGFGALILGTNGLSTKTDAIFLKAEKPYSQNSGWGVGFAYTYSEAKENRQFNEHYALDYPNLAGYGWKKAGGVSKHRLVATGIIDGPLDSVFSAKFTYATPAPRYGTNCLVPPADPALPQDGACFIDQVLPGGSFRQLDMAVSKSFRVPGGTLRLRADLINVLNTKNYDGYDTFFGFNNVPNANLGTPNGSLLGPTRTVKLGLAYAW